MGFTSRPRKQPRGGDGGKGRGTRQNHNTLFFNLMSFSGAVERRQGTRSTTEL